MARTFFYFAYGSNLLTKRIRINNPSATRAGIAKLNDYRLDFTRYSKRWHGCSATIVPHNNYCVWGALWEIDLEHLPSLDRQEGVGDNVYFRFEVEAELPDGSKKKCYVYQQVNNPTDHHKLSKLPESRRPSRVYWDTIVTGSVESGLPDEYRTLLKSITHNGYDGDVTLNLSLNLD